MPERGTFAAWRTAARNAISNHIPPSEIEWSAATGLFAADPLPDLGPHLVNVPPAFLKLAESVIWHAAPERLSDLYTALWRLDQHDGDPLSHADPLGRKPQLMAKSVGRDIHKMHAFVRFRELPTTTPRRSFAAWFEPDHHTLEPGSTFFVKRFSDMDWMIATPDLTARFIDGHLSFAPGGPRPAIPEDASEALWATYFANIFNPARIKINAMQSEMPRKYWKNLPETKLIPEMLADAEARVARMREAGATKPRAGAEAVSTRYRASMPVPSESHDNLNEAKSAAMQCRRCDLCENATQTVWGEGPSNATLMIVGEQPGDREDLEGRPFVGPAGDVLDDALAEAGIVRGEVYLTNAVKHFKFEPRGKLRLHQRPSAREVAACRPWAQAELDALQPRAVVALGVTAGQALLGPGFKLGPFRGKPQATGSIPCIVPTWHPAAILRAGSTAQAEQQRRELVDDLRLALSRSRAD